MSTIPRAAALSLRVAQVAFAAVCLSLVIEFYGIFT